MTRAALRPGVLAAHFVAILIVLVALGRVLPPPAISDHEMMEYVGQGVVNPGCNNLNCWRILAAAIVERFPGPSLPRWRTYAAFGNAAGAAFTAQLTVALGLPPQAALLAMWIAGMSVGSFTTVYHPYTSDSMIFFLAPLILLLLVRQRVVAGVLLSAIGIFAKEFAAVPLYIDAAAAAVQREWVRFRHRLIAAIGVTVLWVGFQLGMMAFFGYAYDANPSIDIFRGGYFWFWYRHVGLITAVMTVFSAFGAAYLLAAAGLLRGPQRLRALAIGAVFPALAFMYVETPDRALFNFFFLIGPLAAIVLSRLPAVGAWTFIAAYALANLRLGTAWAAIPEARYPLALSLVIAIAAIVMTARPRSEKASEAPPQTAQKRHVGSASLGQYRFAPLRGARHLLRRAKNLLQVPRPTP